MRKKKTHTSPKEYRVEYKINGAQNSSIQYYNVYHSSEALDFLAHTYRRGHIHGGELKIIVVEEYNRFSNKWVNRTAKAAEHTEAPEVSVSDMGIVFLKPAS